MVILTRTYPLEVSALFSARYRGVGAAMFKTDQSLLGGGRVQKSSYKYGCPTNAVKKVHSDSSPINEKTIVQVELSRSHDLHTVGGITTHTAA